MVRKVPNLSEDMCGLLTHLSDTADKLLSVYPAEYGLGDIDVIKYDVYTLNKSCIYGGKKVIFATEICGEKIIVRKYEDGYLGYTFDEIRLLIGTTVSATNVMLLDEINSEELALIDATALC